MIMYYLPHIIVFLQWISIIVIVDNILRGNDLNFSDFSKRTIRGVVIFTIATLIHFYAVVDDGIFLYRVMINNEEHLFKKIAKDNFLETVKVLESFPVVSAIKMMVVLPYWEYFRRKMKQQNGKNMIKYLFFMACCCIVGLIIVVAGVGIFF
jgi:hypothetical protein